MYFKNDAFLVLQPRYLRAGDEGAARPRRPISTGDVARVTQMGCGSNKIHSRYPERRQRRCRPGSTDTSDL